MTPCFYLSFFFWFNAAHVFFIVRKVENMLRCGCVCIVVDFLLSMLLLLLLHHLLYLQCNKILCTLHIAQCRVPTQRKHTDTKCLMFEYGKSVGKIEFFFCTIYCFSVDTAAAFDLSYVFDTKSIRISFSRYAPCFFPPTMNAYLHKNANKSKLPAQ